MDDEQTKKLVNLFNAPGQTQDDIIDRQARQQAEADELKIGMLPPEQQQEYRRMQMQKLLSFKPHDPLMPTPTPVTPEQQKLMEQQAMQNYNSPEAQATRARFDPDERTSQGSSNLAEAAGLLKPNDNYRRIRKYLK